MISTEHCNLQRYCDYGAYAHDISLPFRLCTIAMAASTR